MRRSTSSLAACCLGISLLTGAVGCTHSQRQKVSEAVVRGVASKAAEKQFSDRGHPIEGDLTCTAKVDGSEVTLNCKGRTTDGKPATVTGAGTLTNHDTTLKGLWKGTVGATTVFQGSCLGADC